MSLLVLSPHLDDAALSCAWLLQENPGSQVLTVFAGLPADDAISTGWDRECGFGSARSALKARWREDSCACRQLGASPVWLDLADRQYGASSNAKTLAARLRAQLTAAGPATVVVPLGLMHPDHLAVSDAALAALWQLRRPCIAYHDIPYRADRGVVARRIEQLSAAGWSPQALPDVAGSITWKLRVLETYASQWPRLLADEHLDPGDVLRPERFCRLLRTRQQPLPRRGRCRLRAGLRWHRHHPATPRHSGEASNWREPMKNPKASKTKSPKKAAESMPTTLHAVGSVLSTVSGPSTAMPDPAANRSGAQKKVGLQKSGQQALAQAQPFNPLAASQFGEEQALTPQEGEPVAPNDPGDTASTTTEITVSEKTGGAATPGVNATIGTLDRVRVDSGEQALTTNMGVAISDNQNSLKAGLRGPTLLEDFVLREKITHFDHERIPERVVHARGSGAHGYFECYEAQTALTKAAPFTEAGKITPVFVRFSTVAGERGSADLARDVRGFAVKFYTDEGNWDLVGNNIPVFFIQDAIKFPDLVHALKPEPNNQIPQAASAHDTFWDFVSLMPESTHMLLWVMSDRALPRSYRTMQGFGVHSFRLVNAQGESVFCKFHWNPVAGTHSLVWDEAVKINGADPDYHRRDLWEAIEAGSFPEWELGVQTFTEEQAEAFSFDVLDATKIVPEELVPVVPIGRMVLNRNPDNFFAETEQVAFCTANVVPGIDFSNDPLLQGRHHSYLDTQLSRLGGPNFHELPINASIAPVHNNQRDGMHRQAIPRGRVAYEPNSLGGGCPFQAGMRGFTSFATPAPQANFIDKIRGKPEKFADHYTQATLFWKSQSQVEKNHIIAAFRFELTRVQVQAIRERVLGLLCNVDAELAQGVATGLGIPVPPAQPRLIDSPVSAEIERSEMLSLFARPGDGSATGKRVALLVADGIDGVLLTNVYQTLVAAGEAPRFVGARLGTVQPESGDPIHVEITTESAPSVLWDAVVVPGGAAAQEKFAALGQVKEFIKDQYRHCKPILVLDEAIELLIAIGIPTELPDGSADPGLQIVSGDQTSKAVDPASDFIAALVKHRHFERDMDPPLI